MALYKPSELLARLNAIGTGPKKGLSQNFLIDGNIIRNMIKESGIGPGDPVLEIGPGPGALTEALLSAGAHVVAVETDPVLAQALNDLKGETGFLKVIQKDILKTSWEEILSAFPNRQKKIHLIANLPYHITTPVLTKFVTKENDISQILVMVQDEVAKRFSAKEGTEAFGSITLFLQFYSQVTYAFKVGRKCFLPSPKVDSAIIKLKLQPQPQGIDPESFFTLTRTAFQQRRKALRASLKELYPKEKIEEALATLALPPLTRPEELGLPTWIALFKELSHSSIKEEKSS